jgi:hypothetical protein
LVPGSGTKSGPRARTHARASWLGDLNQFDLQKLTHDVENDSVFGLRGRGEEVLLHLGRGAGPG